MNNDSEFNTADKPTKKKLNGFVVIGIILFVVLITTYRPDVPSIHCNKETLSNHPDIIMFGTWWCPYCHQARQYFHDNDIRYCEYDIEKSDIGKQRYDEIEASAIPAFIIGPHVLQGFSSSQIDRALLLTKGQK